MKVAIIGAGIAGLTAAYKLSPRHEVTVLERSGRVGGNAYTVRTRDGVWVDIAAAAFGTAGYPHFHRLLEELGVKRGPISNSYMSFHDLDTGTGMYVTPSLAGLRQQRFDLFRPRHVRSGLGVLRGLAHARRLYEAGALHGQTLGQLLTQVPELRGEARTLFLCALCLMSSMRVPSLLGAPAEFFLEKLTHHHDVISPTIMLAWRGVENGTRAYVEALAARLEGRIELHAALRGVRRAPEGVTVVMESGEARAFDRVVFACPADTALALLEAPTDEERELLGAWAYNDGRVTLHRDLSAFPPRPLMQAYTFLYRKGPDGELVDTSVNGALWFEPQTPRTCDWVSSQYPNFPIDPALVELDTTLRTPIFDFRSVATRARLPGLNGKQGSYFCGSYFGFGLHEDAVSSALAVVQALDADAPR